MTGVPTGSGVLAVVETGITGEPTVASIETLAAARLLAEGLGADLSVVIATNTRMPDSSRGAAKGARSLYELRVPGGAAASVETLVDASWKAIQAARPAAVFLPDSQSARACAARLAARMECDLIAGCTFLKVRGGQVQLGRPCLSGKAFAQLEWDPAQAVVVTVATGAFSSQPASGAVPDPVILEATDGQVAPGVTVLSEIAPTPEAMGVNDADVLVAGGAGVGGPEGFELLVELARKLGGTVAASRVAVDRGWMPSTRQVGLTGKSVSPRVYLAFGISGAPQHIAGIRSVGKVVAINRDPRAPIFQVADLAVVADLHDLVPALLDRLTLATASPAGS